MSPEGARSRTGLPGQGRRGAAFALASTLATALLAAAFAPPTAGATAVTISLVTPAGEPVPEAVVILEPAAPSPPVAGRRYTIDQRDRRFTPRVSVVQAGTSVDFPNSDNVRHHVYSFSPAKTFDLKLYAGRGALPVTFDRPGLVVLGCNIHDAMVAFIVVTPSPHFALTAADGRATLDVPPGRYTLRAWSPVLAATPERRALAVGAAPQLESVVATPAAAPDQVPAWED